MGKDNSSRLRPWHVAGVLALPLVMHATADAQPANGESQLKRQEAPENPLPINRSGRRLTVQAAAAKVDDSPIYVYDVERGVKQEARGQPISPERMPYERAKVLAKLVELRLARQFLKDEGLEPGPAEVDANIENIRQQAKQQNMTLEQHLQNANTTMAAFRADLAWQIGWQQYVQTNVQDDRLEAFFNENKKDFDGTQLRVSHILLRPVQTTRPLMVKLFEQAQELRQKIVDGEIKFEDAARQFSEGPSRERGGDIGFIPRQGLMVPQFSQAAFALADGEISQPVETIFGIHLIRVTETKPGERQWTEVREQLKQPLAHKMLADAIRVQRKRSEVKYFIPYFRDGTRELVQPGDE